MGGRGSIRERKADDGLSAENCFGIIKRVDVFRFAIQQNSIQRSALMGKGDCPGARSSHVIYEGLSQSTMLPDLDVHDYHVH